MTNALPAICQALRVQGMLSKSLSSLFVLSVGWLSSAACGQSSQPAADSGEPQGSVAANVVPLRSASDALLNWWPADGHPYDLIGGNHLSLKGASYQAGKSGGCFRFDGSNDSAGWTKEDWLRPRGNFSIAFWAKPLATITRATESVQARISARRAGQRWLWFPGVGNGIGISCGTNGINVFQNERSARLRPLAAYSFPIRGWNHITVTCRDNQITIYHNGNLVKEGLQSPEGIDVYYNLGGGSLGGYYPGSVDEAMVFSRPLLESEVRAVYTATLGKPRGDAVRDLKLTDDLFETLWSRAIDQGTSCLFAMQQLAAFGDETVVRLRERMRDKPQSNLVTEKLIDRLDHESFQAREAATAALITMGSEARLLLNVALGSSPSPETRFRIKHVLQQLQAGGLSPQQLQTIRAIRVLGRIHSPLADAFLSDLANGSEQDPERIAAGVLLRLRQQDPR